jgi:hypothetical protein
MFTTEIEDPRNPGDYIDIGINYTYVPEEPETGPSYYSGGEPGSAARFEDLEVINLATGQDITNLVDERSLENEIMHDAEERQDAEHHDRGDWEYERSREHNYHEGRTNMTNRISEAKKKAKPDYLDLDKDGNKREPMKKAAKDAKKFKESAISERNEENKLKKDLYVANRGREEIKKGINFARYQPGEIAKRKGHDYHTGSDTSDGDDPFDAPQHSSKKTSVRMMKLAGRDSMKTENKNAKPDYLDLDKDGNKKEPMKKAAKDAKKKKMAEGKMSAAERAHHHAVEYERHHKQGNLEMALHHRDACDECGGMIQHGPMGECWHMHSGKNGGTPYRVSDDTAHNMIMTQESRKFFRLRRTAIAESIATYIAEDEEGKAKAITAGSDMVNDFTTWMQRVGNYQTKSMIELADNIRANFGVQEAERFKGTVGQALESALQSLTATREEINNAVAVLAGEAPAEEQMGQEPMLGNENPMQTGDEYTDQGADDEFAASDAAAGGIETAGRMKRESIERGNRLMRILGS